MTEEAGGTDRFFREPILNNPYEEPTSYWELDAAGQPTGVEIPGRRPASFITPIPKPRKSRRLKGQAGFVFDEGSGLSTEEQQYDPTPIINEIRGHVKAWRSLPSPAQWGVTPVTQRLLEHWRHHEFNGFRPFFCQVEAIETIIWLTEVAPHQGPHIKAILDRLADMSAAANGDLLRLALKLATGAGKTTVMAMLIAWQTINAVRYPQSKRFTRGFLIVTPGITIKDRLRVLQPNDRDSYYRRLELVPNEMLEDLGRAKIVVTNYHAFMLRERTSLSKGGRALLQGRGPEIDTRETEGEMIQRVMPTLANMGNVLVVNDEAHHCYRQKPADPDDDNLKGDDAKEADENNKAARVWIDGLDVVRRKLGLLKIYDLSATPFFLSGSGYREGTLFPWTVSDFSLMDAIESGIVKLPRVPISDNALDDMPMFRDLWKHVRKDLPKGSRKKNQNLDPQNLPIPLQSAINALYGHYETQFALWRDAGVRVPPCFIMVCQNTAISDLVYRHVSGFERTNEDETVDVIPGALELFRNYDEHGNALARPHTLLIDSVQLESGEGMDDAFRTAAAGEIEAFRREALDRGQGADLDDTAILREVMNTVGKHGRLGESIRCVVSVSMLTEGWDANTVTHVLGIRAFGTQLLCEQVVGRALRRQSYEQDEHGLFRPEYADIFGVPFDFTAKPVPAPPQSPREVIHVHAVRPERDRLEIVFPRVQGYRVDLPTERVTATFNDDSILRLTPEVVGATETKNAGIIGEQIDLRMIETNEVLRSRVLMELVSHLVYQKYRKPGQPPESNLTPQLMRVANDWLTKCLVCEGGTTPAYLLFKALADDACERIIKAINRTLIDTRPVRAVLDPYIASGSTASVNFNTTKTLRWETAPDMSHVNWAILDSDWEAELCRVLEQHRSVRAYVKNDGLGFEVPYRFKAVARHYRPDFIIRVDDGHGEDDLLNLVIEVKGYRGEDAVVKKETMDVYWVPGVNALKTYGRWAFLELREVYRLEADFEAKIRLQVDNAFAELAVGHV